MSTGASTQKSPTFEDENGLYSVVCYAGGRDGSYMRRRVQRGWPFHHGILNSTNKSLSSATGVDLMDPTLMEIIGKTQGPCGPEYLVLVRLPWQSTNQVQNDEDRIWRMWVLHKLSEVSRMPQQSTETEMLYRTNRPRREARAKLRR
jgi:hypothetical protein